jgi:hypothetical protein
VSAVACRMVDANEGRCTKQARWRVVVHYPADGASEDTMLRVVEACTSHALDASMAGGVRVRPGVAPLAYITELDEVAAS